MVLDPDSIRSGGCDIDCKDPEEQKILLALLLEVEDKATIPQCPLKAYLIQGFLGDSQLKLGLS